jgi:glycosyltransferase involved in cell wall biosynthesis
MIDLEVSVIVPSYNGAHKLPNILNALLKQTYQSCEIIVVVDGSNDNTREVLELWKQKLPQLKTVYQQNKGRAAVRNTGAKVAKGDLVVFFDDDMRPNETCVLRHLQFHQQNRGCILVGKAGIDPSKVNGYDYLKFKLNSENRWMKNFVAGLNKISLDNYVFTSANLSCSKEIFNQLGGFDERLTDSEDFDYSMRAFKMNIPIYYDSELIAWHDDFSTIEKDILRQLEYYRSKQKALTLQPEFLKMHAVSFSYRKSKNYFEISIRKFFVINKYWHYLFQSGFLFFLPQPIRFRIYDLVLSSSVLIKMGNEKQLLKQD